MSNIILYYHNYINNSLPISISASYKNSVLFIQLSRKPPKAAVSSFHWRCF